MRRPVLLLHITLLLLLLCDIHYAHAEPKPRVRKELRRLSSTQYKAFITGLSVMQSVSPSTGRSLFGPKFRSYNEMLIKHAVSVNDPRGDQGHTGPCFMTFHRSFLLELENSLLSIQPQMSALPYWDITEDGIGGRYYNTPNYIFSEKYAGNIEGDKNNNYGVTTGVFAWRQVPKFIAAQWPQYSSIFNGSPLGYFRSATNNNDSPLVTRYPTSNLVEVIQVSKNGSALLPFANHPNVTLDADYLVGPDGEFTLTYPHANFKRCLNASSYTNWMEWNYCLDLTVLSAAPNSVTEDDKLKYIGPEANGTAMLHAGVHWGVGSVNGSSYQGDMFDIATSPNDILLFALHHANVDRSNMLWARNAAKLNPAFPRQYFGYPATESQYSTAADGCLLNQVINSNGPFTDIFSVPPQNKTGYTHGEVIKYSFVVNNVPYIYDSML